NTNALEQCDDANDDETDSCLDTCVYNVCGDGSQLATISDLDDPDGTGPMTAQRGGTNNPIHSTNDVDDNEVCDDLPQDCAEIVEAGASDFGCDPVHLHCMPGATAATPDVTEIQVEPCDDGNTANTDACVRSDTNDDGTFECVVARCGDG